MADYYPLIARAVAGLDKNTGDARRALYERARAALVAQLRGVTPALDESDVTRERLALEEAIRKVEGESARQSTSRSDTAMRVKAPEFPRWTEPEPESDPEPDPEPLPQPSPRRQQETSRPDGRQAAVAPAARQKAETRFADPGHEASTPPDPVRRPQTAARQDGRAAGQARPKTESRHIEPSHGPASQEEPEPQEPPRAATRPRPTGDRVSGERRSLSDSGMRDFREVVSEANELGGASARATRSARESYAAVPPPETNRSKPRPADSDEAYLTLDDIAEPVMLEPSFTVDESRPAPRRGRQSPPGEVERAPIARRNYGDLIRIAVAVAVVGGIGSLLIWQWPNIAAIYSMLSAPAQQADQTPPVNPPTTKPKNEDRIEPGGKPSPQQTSPDAANVAQRVVLYEEDPSDPNGKRSVGSVIWRTETMSPGAGKPPELAVRADIEIPERKISMTWKLSRDTDASRTTSHTIEIMIKLPPDFPYGGILSVPGIWMKQAEQVQGTALSGAAIKVTTGYFLIGLSGAPADKERNVQLLKERPWFDIPIVYTNNRRAILAMEKGTPGDRAFAQAFAAWEK
jgi:hypothetical protein